jgi:hypothetical protein
MDDTEKMISEINEMYKSLPEEDKIRVRVMLSILRQKRELSQSHPGVNQ